MHDRIRAVFPWFTLVFFFSEMALGAADIVSIRSAQGASEGKSKSDRAVAAINASSPGELKIKPLTLDDCVQLALDNNPAIWAARDGVAAAREGVGEAKAPYYPELGLSGGYNRFERHVFLPSGIARPDIPTTVGPADDWTANLKARYTLYDGGKRGAKLRAAMAGKEVAEEDRSRIEKDIAFAVHRAYYGYVAARKTLSVAEENLRRAEDHLRLAGERKAAGAVARADVVRAQTRVADEKLNLVRAQHLVRSIQADLNTVMGLAAEKPLDVELSGQTGKPLEEIHLTQAYERALRNRSEIRTARQRVEIARYGVEAARSDLRPQVRLEAKYGRQDENFFPEDNDWMAGVILELPLFTGFSTTHGLARRKAELRREEAEVERIVQNVRREVWAGILQIREAEEAIRTAVILVRDAQEGVRLTRERYAVGAGTITDLLDAQAILARAQARRVEAEWNGQIAKAAFDHAVGSLLGEAAEGF